MHHTYQMLDNHQTFALQTKLIELINNHVCQMVKMLLKMVD